MSKVPVAPKFRINSALPMEYIVPKTAVANLGREGACVSYTMTEILKHLAKVKHTTYTKDYNYYYKNRKDKKVEGMTVLEAMEYAKKQKLISKFAKIQDPTSLKATIYYNGPCAICLPAGSDGTLFWKYGSNVGHCIAVVGWDENGFILKNSWGPAWGAGGYVTLPYSDWKYIWEIWTILQ